jgi:hypothetical protein
MNSTETRNTLLEALPAAIKERAIQAKKTYCNACEEYGVKACSWESFSGYQDYVAGRINESELAGRADEEIKDLTRTFGKYIVVEKEKPVASSEEDEKRKRARAANKVYKTICSESGIGRCFFDNFATWSDYVQGRIDESEFSEKARLEVEKMKASADQN